MKKFFLFIILAGTFLKADVNEIKVGIDEKLGRTLPLQSVLVTENGEYVKLGTILNKPTILLFVYYECPGLCTPLMSEVAAKINELDMIPGKDYQVVSVSIDHEEDYKLAAKKKVNYMNLVKKPMTDSSWYFLTGDSVTVNSLADAAGFKFIKEEDEFIHAGTLIMVSPKGVITRYLLGTSFLPFDVKMGLLEASEGRITPTVAKMLKFCFSYDRESKTYVLNVTRIAGTGIIFLAVVFVIIISVKSKKRKDAIG
ncbi:MAG: SCO family protein [Ignavibacteriaceae bacterium]|nr:SCO family protein [Ignavibacteriaceae bacterium]